MLKILAFIVFWGLILGFWVLFGLGVWNTYKDYSLRKKEEWDTKHNF